MAKKKEEGRYKHMSRIHQVPTFLNSASKRRLALLRSTGFGAFTLMCDWSRVPGPFVKWVCESFELENCQLRLNNMLVLPIKSEDVHRVYDLPNEGKRVDLSKCKQASVELLRKEFKWDLKVKDIYRATISELEDVIKGTKNDTVWCKAMILYLISCMLCPDNLLTISLKYAYILEDLKNVSKYNWCKLVFNHLKDGIKGRKYPQADMHFLMIHYIERMGKEGAESRDIPTLQGWDTTHKLKELAMLASHFGFGAGITSGYALRPVINYEQRVSLVLMEADLCPLDKAPEYLRYCEYQCDAFKKCVKKLEVRLKDDSDDEEDELEGSHDDYRVARVLVLFARSQQVL